VIQRTLVVLKPDAVKRSLVGRVIQRLEDAGLKIVGAKMRAVDADFARRHYFDLAERWGEAAYRKVADFMQSGPVLALAVEGVDAVPAVRKLVGHTFPAEAAPGTIRGDFAHHSKAHADDTGGAIMNLVHASGNAEEAAYEVSLWFADDELFDYATAAEAFTF
jgi:nucleoside-diphosphate kinase